jgi:hypothetical protein
MRGNLSDLQEGGPNIAKKIKVKQILELRAAQMSQREIYLTRKMPKHSVGDAMMDRIVHNAVYEGLL